MIVGISGKIGSGKDTVGAIWQYLSAFESRGEEDSYVGDTLQKGFIQGFDYYDVSNWEIRKFAGKVKRIASMLTGIPILQFEKEEVKNSPLGPEWMVRRTPNLLAGPKGADAHYDYFYSPLTVREVLQKLGTDCMRDQLHPNVWVNALFADYKPIKQCYVEHGSQIVREYVYPDWLITDVRFPNEAKAIKDRGGLLIRVERPGTSSGDHPSETSLDSYQYWDYLIINDGSIQDLVEKVKTIYHEYRKAA